MAWIALQMRWGLRAIAEMALVTLLSTPRTLMRYTEAQWLAVLS